jgi:hypothetical protein
MLKLDPGSKTLHAIYASASTGTYAGYGYSACYLSGNSVGTALTTVGSVEVFANYTSSLSGDLLNVTYEGTGSANIAQRAMRVKDNRTWYQPAVLIETPNGAGFGVDSHLEAASFESTAGSYVVRATSSNAMIGILAQMTSSTGNPVAIKAVAASSTNSESNCAILAEHTGGGPAISAVAKGSASSSNHGLRAVKQVNGAAVSAGIVAGANAFDFYADGPGTNYGPFTGSHEALIQDPDSVVVGDIVVDLSCINRKNVSNAIFTCEPSSAGNLKTALGVVAVKRGLCNEGNMPAALQVIPDTAYFVLNVNAVGEGLINVCGENGNIEAGDLIVTSNMPGKGMRQDDDIVRNCTVARAREGVTFSTPNEVKQIACIYLCG